MSTYVGLDVNSDHTYATMINEDGKIVCKKRIASAQVLNFLKPFEVQKVGFESSTSIAPIYRALVKEGYRVQVSHPKKTRYIAEDQILA